MSQILKSLFWRHSKTAIALSAIFLGSTAVIGGARADNADVRIGLTPKFLKDDFQTLMLDLSKKAFKAKGFTLIGAPDPNGDIAAQVDALQNLLANGANVLVFAPIDAAGIVPAVRKANDANALVFSIDDAPVGGKVTATVRADNLNAGAQGAEEMAKRLKDKACWTAKSCIVLELQGSLKTPNGLDRSKGFATKLKELAPDVQLIQRPTEWRRDHLPVAHLAGQEKPSGAEISSERDTFPTIGFVPTDRHTSGYVGILGVRENVAIGGLDLLSNNMGFIRQRREHTHVRQLIEQTNVIASSLEQAVSQLSGGNQQKVVFARSLCRDPEVVVALSPTRGVDVGAKEQLYALLRKLASEGLGVVVVSDEEDEIDQLANRVVIVFNGQVVDELVGAYSMQDLILHMEGAA